uniref:Dynamin-type G domain-containing protein n=1 Tax=Heterosigma akashiwo TaxID=2829 RepID=A0A6V2RT65_HETAK|eukprot:CAMPEP_0194575360 /NCGR_PEP_ID=MMETSP0292-20121207/10866_1 /TAXON_ID=39354 /ORGANISM="Heterosigma akashiwo, Strain CCMP2393" /LENGTH=754 /DNA_ID=CAMNT_0039427113 /DNA_START=57 /DNA_END=2321 /DNA_ORIENTATION=+
MDTYEEIPEEKSAIGYQLDKDVKPWLDLMEDLRSLSMDKELSIPQIAVMGDQSSGKSSVLEALSNVPFPRGSGLTTRCPVRLVMRTALKGQSWAARVSTTKSTQPPVAVSSPEELTPLIERFTNTLTNGQSSEFSAESIVVEIAAPDAPNLTLIDLPGIIRTATAGQSAQVMGQINALIDSYLRQERTLILAVIPANQDIATIDILERAQQVDPAGDRTVGVLTKADLIGPGSEAEVAAVLTNQRKPLKLGYVMVKNRSQADITAGLSSRDARQSEESFFTTHPDFGRLDPSLFGVRRLTGRLTRVLVGRIQRELVPMRAEVEAQLGAVRQELKAMTAFHQPAAAEGQGRQKLMVAIVQEYVRHLTECVAGEYRDRRVVVDPDLRLYTRALTIFETLKNKVSASSPDFEKEDFINVLAQQMDELRGRELPGFMSPQSFYMFMAQYLEQWRGPAKVAVSEMRSLCLEVASKLTEIIAVQYPALREGVKKVAAVVLEETMTKALDLVDELLDREKDPFTANDFLAQHVNKIRYDRFELAVVRAFETAAATGTGIESVKQGAAQELQRWYRETHGVNSSSNAEDMSAILEAYWTLASRRFVDNVCMGIDRTMLNSLAGRIQEECYMFVHDEEKLAAFFEEDARLAHRRRELLSKQERLMKANAAMASLQVRRSGPSKVTVTLEVDEEGLGLLLTEDNGKIIVKGFKPSPSGRRNQAQDAGVCPGDIIEAVNEQQYSSFDEGVALMQTSSTVILQLGR